MKNITTKDGQSADLVGENIEQMKRLFPEAFGENGVDFDVLRQLLGDAGVLDEGEEKYGLNWHGKKKARQIALTPSMGTLMPCPEESVDWDTTQNLFIEGDNLEVLKLLQTSYANKVKMIYIDPPYNTGKEFVYPDRFQDSLETYLKYTGQKGEDGLKLTSNTESGGRKHANWLNMIYPRLKVAKNLLARDGVIFVSIDDNEYAELKKVCDEIFGEDNFIEAFIWHKKTPPNNVVVGAVHEYILMFAKDKDSANLHLLPRDSEKDKDYKNPDNDPRGRWKPDNLTAAAKGGRSTPSLLYTITNPETGQKYDPPEGRMWAVPYDAMLKKIEEGTVYWGKNGDGRPMDKRFLSQTRDGRVASTLLNDAGTNSSASKALNQLFDGLVLFETPKPVEILKRFAHISTKDSDVVLDFFSGSCATAHAIFEINLEDAGKRKCISVQLPEITDEKSEAFKAGYKTVADIAKERIRRAAKKIQDEKPDYEGDLGFKVFKLAQSNIRVWNPDRTDLEETLLSHQEHLLEGRTEQDLLYELLLKRGVDLAVPIETRKVVGKTIYSIGAGVLFACLDPSLDTDEIESVAEGILAWQKELDPEADTHVFFRDSAFNNDNVAKTNMVAILEQNGITHVRSL